MATTSARTIRIRGIPEDVTTVAFHETCDQWSQWSAASAKWSNVSWAAFRNPPAGRPVRTSLAIQDGHKTGTLTFNTEDAKARILAEECPEKWTVDDKFDGLTVLSAPEKPDDTDIDICAVHGLQGNAFDTWTSNKAPNPEMWLRDFLPTTLPFQRSRIMTFGYSSQLKDNVNIAGVKDWADILLFLVGNIRKSTLERQRPIIFVCHSLGGIVLREAMVRLNAHPEKYHGIRVENCGLLFLGTPHSGTVQADWNDFVTGIAVLLGVRFDVVDSLRSFNGFSVESKEAFGSLPKQPPYFCLCETKLVTIAPGISRLVVTKDSAGLNGVVAFPMPDVDHKEMCRFDNKFHDGYILVIERLSRLRDILLGQKISAITEYLGELPGHPPITEPRFPLPVGKPYYEGKGLLRRGKERLIGRVDECVELQWMIQDLLIGTSQMTALAISGMGGIGKTELLLTLASRNRDVSNIFLLKTTSSVSAQDALLSIANNIGSELLVKRHRNQYLYGLWSDLTDSQRIEAFKQWLTEDEAEQTLFLVDDIEALSRSDMNLVLSQPARNVVLTTRNPVILMGLTQEFNLNLHHFRLGELNDRDIVSLTSRAFENLVDGSDIDWETEQLRAISKIAFGHPLVAARITSFISTEYSEQYGHLAIKEFAREIETRYEERKIPPAIFTYEPMLQISIAENFHISRKRLPRPDGPSWILVQLIAFMELENAAFINFLFLERPWIIEFQEHFSFYEIWSADHDDLRSWLSSLRKVSFGTANSQSAFLRFHPVLIQCIQEQVGHETRVKIAKDILLLASESIKRPYSSSPEKVQSWITLLKMLQAQALHCAKICKVYGISQTELGIPQKVLYPWFDVNKECL